MSVVAALAKTFVIIAAIALLLYYLNQLGFINQILSENQIGSSTTPIAILVQNSSSYYGKHVTVNGELVKTACAIYGLYDYIGHTVELVGLPSNVTLNLSSDYSVSGVFAGNTPNYGNCATIYDYIDVENITATPNQG
jgi:hypothetical protein